MSVSVFVFTLTLKGDQEERPTEFMVAFKCMGNIPMMVQHILQSPQNIDCNIKSRVC